METINWLPSPLKAVRSIPGPQLGLMEMLKSPGTKDDPFYVIDSSELESISSFFRPVKTDDVSLLYVDKGELSIRLHQSIHILTESTLFIKTPNTILEVLDISEDCHFRIFGFLEQCMNASAQPIKHLEALALSADDGDRIISLDTGDAASIEALFTLFRHKRSQKEKSPYYNELMHLTFSLFTLEIASIFRKKTDCPSGVTRKENLTIQFLKLLRQHIKEQRSVNFYASLLYVSAKHLSKSIKDVTGKTCREIIDEMVVSEAKNLLGDPSLTIAQVADELNFSDQFFFSKYFKRQTGSSPLLYRTAV